MNVPQKIENEHNKTLFRSHKKQQAPHIIGVEKGKGAGWPQVEGIGRAIKPSHHRQNQTSLTQELGDHIGTTPATQTAAP